ncbi:MAG: hypothetical protein KJT03_03295 [Verrucomicrobiae bacterium]|nr:hypothetical protein [Verrucomicrobiae bacterium]
MRKAPSREPLRVQARAVKRVRGRGKEGQVLELALPALDYRDKGEQ